MTAICNNFQRNGTCKYGTNCKFSHDLKNPKQAKAKKNPPKTATLKTDPTAIKNVELFVKRLNDHKDPQKLASFLSQMETFWHEAWAKASDLGVSNIQGLAVALSRIPFSDNMPPPSIVDVSRALAKLIKNTSNDDPEHLASISEIAINVAKRLLRFEWKCPRDVVKESIESILDEAGKGLSVRHQSHRLATLAITSLYDELCKPWSISVKGAVNEVTSNDGKLDWKHATVAWLMDPMHFLPPNLPQMRVPKDSSGGVYASSDEYMATISKLWIGLTFGEGHNSISPLCRWHEKEKTCNHVLWPVDGSAVDCATTNCHQSATFACCNRNHNYGLCVDCMAVSRQKLIGEPSKNASTHLYDGKVEKVTFDGQIYISQFASRKPPITPIHWRSTKRLTSPSLVAIVKTSAHGERLSPNAKIYWCEVSLHESSDQKGESNYRELGKLIVTAFEFYHDLIDIVEGDTVAILDCQTFVPEFIPVLDAIEIQKANELPFSNGELLNLTRNNRYSANELQLEKAGQVSCVVFESDINALIERSELSPIVQIRRDPDVKAKLSKQLFNLVQTATLDQGQLNAFLAALTYPVHCTQGPPGTGKSYVGVVMCQALMIIRDLWIGVNPSVGRPPILVLSYKNHAIDEFLMDLVNTGKNTNMIRIGGSSKEPSLAQYSERSNIYNNYEVQKWKKAMNDVNSLRLACREISKQYGIIRLSRLDDMALANDDKNQKSLEYEAATQLGMLIKRIFNLLGVFHDLRETPTTFKLADIMALIIDHESISEMIKSAALPSTDKTSDSMLQFPILQNGYCHYTANPNPVELLWLWMTGFVPQPPCNFPECSKVTKSGRNYCEVHLCKSCLKEPITEEKLFCTQHACVVSECLKERITDLSFCVDHACFICLDYGEEVKPAQEEPPRNVCSNHVLCTHTRSAEHVCFDLAENGGMFCKFHQNLVCQGITKKGKRCTSRALMNKTMYCASHIRQSNGKFDISELDATQSSSKVVNRCNALTSKGKLCKGKPFGDTIYCKDHQSHHIDIENFVESGITALPPPAEDYPIRIDPFEVKQKEHFVGKEKETFFEVGLEVSEDDQSYYKDFEDIEVLVDNIDEIEIADHLEHLREIHNVEDEKDETETLEKEFEKLEESSANELSWTPLKFWAWEMTKDERWNIIDSILDLDGAIIKLMDNTLENLFGEYRRELKMAKIRAKSSAYEGKSIIAGTIVGCIGRLEAVRATNPFAILIEEASEVMEPLLFSCLGPSICKLEMIGDHLQLQPSVMNKFDFEKVNKINISMFERLICAPTFSPVPSSVLSIQRRMRAPICDLTREYYKDITDITDHPNCSSRLIGGVPPKLLKVSNGKGLLVPCVIPQIFFWEHSGIQTKAQVGLSKENKHEANMVKDLVLFLTANGVPKTSIAILTPYKGQLMLLRKILIKENLMATKSNTNSVVLSTVDRFQGDEADIVIASLVIDSKSQTPFVKLVNRMIVLLSRARIGMYIIGNIGYFENRGVDHWKKTIEILKEPGSFGIDKLELAFGNEQPRIGTAIPICCSLHRQESQKLVTNSADLKQSFCEVICTHQLECGHPCNQLCHWPVLNHECQCKFELDSPCSQHPGKLLCHKVMQYGMSLDASLLSYRCREKVQIVLPCNHLVETNCYEETEIAKGNQILPVCRERSTMPFVFPDCKHQKYFSCVQYHQFQANPDLAKRLHPCQELVDKLFNCGHEARLKCYIVKNIETGQTSYQCAKKVETLLPRCHHMAEIPCDINNMIHQWKGNSVEPDQVLRFNANYGPKDYLCDENITIQLPCGHEIIEKCNRAFEIARTTPKCREMLRITLPYCGHSAKLECLDVQLIQGLLARVNDPIKIVNEERIPQAFLLKYQIGIVCKKQVSFKRKCGHSLVMDCSSLRTFLNSPTECLSRIEAKNPICGHPLLIECCASNLWEPWNEQFVQSEFFEALMKRNELMQNCPVPTSAPDQIAKLLGPCNHKINFVLQDCGHSITMSCMDAFKQLGKRSTKACAANVNFTLECGHSLQVKCQQYQEYLKGNYKPVCKEIVQQHCQNFDICGSLVSAPCASHIVTCDKVSTFECQMGHSFDLKLCKLGKPDNCLDCENDRLFDYLEELNERLDTKDFQSLDKYYPAVLDQLECLKLSINGNAMEQFLNSQITALTKFAEWTRSVENPWQQPLFESKLVPCFAVIPSIRGNYSDFKFTKIAKYARLLEWTEINLENVCKVAKGQSVDLLVGLVFTCSASITESEVPKPAKPLKEWLKNSFEDKFDIIVTNSTCFLCPPWAVIATHVLKLSALTLEVIRGDLPKISQFTPPRYIQFSNAKLPETIDLRPFDVFNETIANGCSTWERWNGTTLFVCPTKDQEELEANLRSQLLFVPNQKPSRKSKNNVYSGINYLNTLQTSNGDILEYELLKCLEFLSLREFDEARVSLDHYCNLVRSRCAVAHPLLFIALSRLEDIDQCKKDEIVHTFRDKFGEIASSWLNESELQTVKKIDPSVLQSETKSKYLLEWEQLKELGCESEAMDKLLDLVGLAKVKTTVLKLFQNAIALSKMRPQDRKLSVFTFNYAFLGNPGTGKTSVARLLAEILYDSGIRKNNVFSETTAQKLKDDGPDKFRKLVDSAMDGVLFIDEAYDLDPLGDFKGKPIVSELLTAAENFRDRLTIIIAGYEADIHSKLYDYNDGLRSRFSEVLFEDFDRYDLELVWRQIADSRNWKYDERIPAYISRKLALSANKKGFGNARAMRKEFEMAMQKALCRPDWNGDLFIKIEDVAGDNPLTNSKLKILLEELDQKIGWNSVKVTIKQMVELAEKNYQRSLIGQSPLSICLNRLFLGNPGTGKTTCAVIYGKILKSLGYLSGGDVVFKTASDFRGNHVGQSATKTNEILKIAQGKVLVIDEAYVLNDNLYGKQVLDTLVEKIQGSPSDDIAVCLLGYEQPMLDMIRTQNPGLARRFPRDYAIYFEDYTESEFFEILQQIYLKDNLKPSSYEVSEKLLHLLRKQRALPNFGNVGSLNLLVQAAVAKATLRQQPSQSYITLIPEDIETGVGENKDPFEPLESLINIENVKAEIQSLYNSLKVAQAEGSDLPPVGHFVFRGSPGTGKTTVARVLADILYQLELIPINNIVETSGLDLTASFVGQTKEKVTEKLNQARGSILFIDEAYELGIGPYGKEAMTTLLAAMTDPTYKGMVIVIAGYAKDIDEMLNRNVGLKSRFTKFFDFQDWNPEESVQFVKDLAKKDGFGVNTDALNCLKEKFAELQKLPGWANGRDVIAIWKSILEHRSNRVVAKPETVKTIKSTEVEKAANDLICSRTPPEGYSPRVEINDWNDTMPFNFAMENAKDFRQEVQEQFKARIEELADSKPEEPTKSYEDEATKEDILELEEAKIRSEKEQADLVIYRLELEKLKDEKKKQEAQMRLELEQRQREETLAKLRQLMPCPAGFNWYKCGNGWRCAGGSHFVSQQQLEKSFMQ